ncbi:hypothetical protein NVP1084O_159 [Vibrio phage 1.084.O._10N.261.49.F5]|nr:hypothetical protein NVP1084O_159 [Vibrio phage 1.084.O._10N.261.49.F5]
MEIGCSCGLMLDEGQVMAKVEDIKEEDEARTAAIENLAMAVKSIIPNRKHLIHDQQYPKAETPYLVYDVLSDINLSGGLSEKPISYWVDDTGKEIYLYQGMIVLELAAYQGQAYNDLKKIKNFLGNYRIRYNYFLKDGLYGLTDLRTVQKLSYEADEQKTFQSANMRLTLTYLFRYEDSWNTTIEGVEWKDTIKSGDAVFENEGNLPLTS